MPTVPHRRCAAAALLLSVIPAIAAAQDGPTWSGQVSVEFRGFFRSPADPDQRRAIASLAVQPEFHRAWRAHSLLVVPFARLDSADPERTHLDVRELLWRTTHDAWELRAGLGKVFWGAAEAQHLVDVINQTDFIENVDMEDKLGQPMVALTLVRRWGHLDLLLLPGFRERTFPGQKGRLRFPLRIARELTEYAASSGRGHLDAAARWSHVLGAWDIGLAHFRGTGREPLLLLGTAAGGEPVLVPRYVVINQTSLDLQGATGGWLWKLEAMSRSGQGDRFGAGGRFNALTGGFEYTFGDVGGTGRDLSLLVEYLFDDRGRRATTPFEDDIFAGVRVELNDAQSTRVLAGAIVDRRTRATFASIEASRRLGERWRVDIESRFFVGLQPDDYLFGFRKDQYAQLDLSWFF